MFMSGVVSIPNTTASTSTTTGALTVGGGIGIGGDIYAAGTVNAYRLVITGTGGTFTSTNSANARYDTTTISSDSGTKAVVAEFTGYTMAQGYYTYSDARIKESITDLPLNTSLSQIRPVNYYYIDKTRDNTLKRGFVAQEVEKIYPELVTSQPGFLPNIFVLAKVVNKNTFSLSSLDVVLSENDKLLVYASTNGKEERKECQILKITDGQYTLDIEFERIFIYGTHSDDVKAVDYEGFIPIIVSNIQRQDREINELKKMLAAQQRQIEYLVNR